MKRCPQCDRTYADEQFKYCPIDAQPLASSFKSREPLDSTFSRPRPAFEIAPRAAESAVVNRSSADDAGLFPLYGVTLGETTVEQLARMGTRTSTIDSNTGKPYKCYVINGEDFWFGDTGFADLMYLVQSDPFPEQWQDLGFDWDLSYNGWLNLLRRLGFLVRVSSAPKIVEWSGHDSFEAEVLASKQSAPLYELKLDFSYGTGTHPDDHDTLYSINVSLP